MGGPSEVASGTPGFWETYYLDIQTPDIWATNTPSANPEKWKRSVIAILQSILQTGSGSALLRSMKRMAQWIDVHPLSEIECNAHGGFPGTRVINGRWYEGRLQFNPDVYMSGSSCYKRKHHSYGKEPDQVMFHELVHAHRAASWLIPHKDKLLAGLSGYQDEEEFLAVILTNIYISETKGRGLRADYYSYGELIGRLSSSIGFFQSSPQVLRILNQLAVDQRFLFEELAKVKAPFNPLAAMQQHPDEVERISYSKESMEHERTAPKQAAAQLARLRKDAQRAKDQDAKDLRKQLAWPGSRNFKKDLAGMLAEAALQFLPK
jgi:hypothetical protein